MMDRKVFLISKPLRLRHGIIGMVFLFLFTNIFSSCTYDQIDDVDAFKCGGKELSFSGDIKKIIENNCAISNCHDGSTSLPDFNQFSKIQENASEIKRLTQNGVMPKKGSLTDQQINDIACWVDQGAQNN